MNVIYIGSQSRSGSTICDLLIGQIGGVTSLGELKVFDREMRQGARCSCGQEGCAVVGGLRRQLIAQLGQNLGGAEGDLLRLRGLPLALVSRARRRRIKAYFHALQDALEAEVEGTHVVDSSKCPARLFWYRRYFPGNVTYLRLVRAPSHVAASLSKPWGKRDQDRGQQVDFFGQSRIKTYGGWVLSNLLFNVLGGAPDHVVTYADMARAPDALQGRMAQILGLEPPEPSRAITDRGHLIAGSRWRLAQALEVTEAGAAAPSWWDRVLLGAGVRGQG